MGARAVCPPPVSRSSGVDPATLMMGATAPAVCSCRQVVLGRAGQQAEQGDRALDRPLFALERTSSDSPRPVNHSCIAYQRLEQGWHRAQTVLEAGSCGSTPDFRFDSSSTRTDWRREPRPSALLLTMAAPPSEDRSLYALLGVASTATDDEIKRAYRQLATTLHPDKVANSAHHDQAAQLFTQIQEAYEVRGEWSDC